MPSSSGQQRVRVGDALRAVRVPFFLALLIGLLGWGLWWGWTHVLSTPGATPAVEACATRQATPYGAEQVTVSIYNGGARGGTGGQVAANLRKVGFTVRTIANTDERVAATIVRGRSADSPAVVLVAGFFTGVVIQADGRADDTVDVLVGREFAPMVLTAPTATVLPPAGCTSATPRATTSAAPSAPAASAATPSRTP